MSLIKGDTNVFNYVSDYFMNDLRMHLVVHMVLNLQYKDGMMVIIFGVFLKRDLIWRGVNDAKELSRDTYTMSFRLGTYIATQFKPIVAKTIYEMSDAKTVLDTSMGWGDRLTVSMIPLECYTLYWL